jgi:hypothetical protein
VRVSDRGVTHGSDGKWSGPVLPATSPIS